MDNDYFRTLLKAPRPKLQPIPTKDVCEIEKEQENKRIKAERAECHRKKKEHYMKMKQKYENNLLELTKKYRDRAQERRERVNNEPNIDDAMLKKNGYHAVAPDLKSSINAREIKDKMIEESKYLGGDIEHTHLVKGLDYALLQKVREEIKIKEADEASTNEMVNGKPREKDKEIPVECKSYLAKQIYKYAFPSKDIELNPLFAPGRMAYVMNLFDDKMDTDIPTILIRSKTEIPNNQSTMKNSVNDIIINKLTQIFSYLRHGPRHKKHKTNKRYFKDCSFGEEHLNSSRTDEEEGKKSLEKVSKKSDLKFKEKPSKRELISMLTAPPTSYVECYLGQEEMNDAIEDSDDEIDYSKMDLGGHKGIVGRWDFDSLEEYNKYLNNKEALPKAAFQYGLKMNEGRRTRKNYKKNEKGEINQEWNTIKSMILNKRKKLKDDSDLLLVPNKLSRKK